MAPKRHQQNGLEKGGMAQVKKLDSGDGVYWVY